MTELQPQAPSNATPTTRDYLLLIFAGVIAHPSTLASVSEYVDEGLVTATNDAACKVLWRYLQSTDAPTRFDAFAELLAAGVPDAANILQRLSDAALELTPKKIIVTTRKLTRTLTNTRRREHVKQECERTPVEVLDVEAIAEDAARRYPHSSTSIQPLTLDVAEAALAQRYTVVPTGFAALDRHFDGWIVGEFHLMPARTGDNKSTLTYGCVRNQFFANAARHRDDPWWEQFSSEWGRVPCHRSAELLRPLHAGHDDKRERHLAPHVIWFSLEEPLAQVLGRFYCDLLTLDRGKWIKRRSYRDDLRKSYAAEIAHINEVLGSGRLTIVDYCKQPREAGVDVEFVEQTLADISKKLRAWARECERRDAEESKREGSEIKRPRLCFVDYAQLINVPDDRAREEHSVLAKVSTTLRQLATQVQAAVVAPVMLLRDSSGGEPTKDAIKGSSQFAQDAARIFTLWPLSKRERVAVRAALDLAQQRAGETPKTDALAASEWDSFPTPSEGTQDMIERPPSIAALNLCRALGELRLAGEKDRFGDPAWTIRLHVDGVHARVTDGLPDIDDNAAPIHVDDTGKVVTAPEGHPRCTSYREHPDIKTVLSPPTRGRKKE